MLNLDHKASLADDDSSLEQHGPICQMPDTVLLPTTIALPWSQRERAKVVLPHRCPHPRLRALLLLHRSALAPLGVFAFLWVANPRKGRIRQPSCFHESHYLTSRVIVSVLPYQRGLPLRLSLPFCCMAMTTPPLLHHQWSFVPLDSIREDIHHAPLFF